MVEHLVFADRAATASRKAEIVVYGFFDFQLMETDPPSLISNGAFAYYQNPVLASRFYTSNPVERFLFVCTGSIPLLTERTIVWEKVEKFRRKVGRIGLPAAEASELGRVEDFAIPEAKQYDGVTSHSRVHLRSNVLFSPETFAFIKTAHRISPRIVFVAMPTSLRHRNIFDRVREWDVLKTRQKQCLREEGIDYLDASDWIPDQSDYVDDIHLNRHGAELFSGRLDEWLAHHRPEQVDTRPVPRGISRTAPEAMRGAALSGRATP